MKKNKLTLSFSLRLHRRACDSAGLDPDHQHRRGSVAGDADSILERKVRPLLLYQMSFGISQTHFSFYSSARRFRGGFEAKQRYIEALRQRKMDELAGAMSSAVSTVSNVIVVR